MLSEKDILARKEQMKDLLRAAERERRARQLPARRSGRRRLHRRVLVWLGSRMVDLGSYLEQSFGPEAPSSGFRVAGHERLL